MLYSNSNNKKQSTTTPNLLQLTLRFIGNKFLLQFDGSLSHTHVGMFNVATVKLYRVGSLVSRLRAPKKGY